MTTQIGILAFNDMEELDAIGPWEVFSWAAKQENSGLAVCTIGSGSREITCAKVAPDCTWVTSVCTGALLLHRAGQLQGKRATTYWAAVDLLRGGGNVEVMDDVRFVRDGNVVTSAGISAGMDMSLWLLGQLKSPEFARFVQKGIEYFPAPPYTAAA